MNVTPSSRLAHVGEYYFSTKLEAIRKLTESGVDIISLGIGSPDLPPPPEAIEAAEKSLEAPGTHGYSSYRSTPELRGALARWYEATYRVKLDPSSQILPLLGSKEGILYLAMALLNTGDGILIPNPGYPAYTSVSQLLGLQIHAYDLTDKTDWLPDFEALERRDLSGVKLMLVNYPHMPTGKRADPKVFARLVEFARKHRILVCNDNPYGLVLNREPPLSLLGADPEMTCTAELNSLSKSFNMAGWRVGMLAGSRALIDAVLQVKSNVDSGMFSAVQKGAVAALAAPPAWHAERNRILAERRDWVAKIFDRLGFEYSEEQVGLFVWAKAPETVPDVPAFLDIVLERARVFLVPGMVFGSNGTRYARASLCVPVERLREAYSRIEAMTSGGRRS